MRALLQGHEKRSAVGSATPDFFSADILHCFSLQHSQLKAHWKKKKSIAYPKKLKKARISKEMAAAAQRHPRGLAITSRGAPHCPPTPSPPLGRGRARTRGPLTRRPAARLYGGRRPRAPTPAAAAGRYGTAPRDAAQRRSFPGMLSFPCRSSPLCSLAFFFFRIKITVLPPSEVLRCVPLGLKYQQPEQLKLPLAREK